MQIRIPLWHSFNTIAGMKPTHFQDFVKGKLLEVLSIDLYPKDPMKEPVWTLQDAAGYVWCCHESDLLPVKSDADWRNSWTRENTLKQWQKSLEKAVYAAELYGVFSSLEVRDAMLAIPAYGPFETRWHIEVIRLKIAYTLSQGHETNKRIIAEHQGV